VNGDYAAGKKPRVTRKHVIIGVTCAVIVAMVIAGVLVGVKFHLDNTNNLVKVYYSSIFSATLNAVVEHFHIQGETKKLHHYAICLT